MGLISKHTPQAVDETLAIKAEIAQVDKAMSEAVELLGTDYGVDKIKAKLATLGEQKKKLEMDLQAMTVKTMAHNEYPTAYKAIRELINGGFITNGKPLKLTEAGKKFTQAQLIDGALQDIATRKKLKGILPLVVKEIRCDTKRNGYRVIDHDGNESPFMPLAK